MTSSGDIMDDKLLTKKQVAEFLGYTTRSVDRFDADRLKEFPRSIRVRGKKRWKQSEIIQWLDDQNRNSGK